jgi:putative transposase
MVIADVQAWRTWPLERVYPIVYLDALMVKVREDRSVRTSACCLAIGVTVEGERGCSASDGRSQRARSSGWPS